MTLEMPNAGARPTDVLNPVPRWCGQIGAIAAAVLGVIHAGIFTVGFFQSPSRPWVAFLVGGLGVAAVAIVIAISAWRLSRRIASEARRTPSLVVTWIGGIGLSTQAVLIAVSDPIVLLQPLGPGPWSVIAGPTLLILAAAGTRRWVKAGPSALSDGRRSRVRSTQ